MIQFKELKFAWEIDDGEDPGLHILFDSFYIFLAGDSIQKDFEDLYCTFVQILSDIIESDKNGFGYHIKTFQDNHIDVDYLPGEDRLSLHLGFTDCGFYMNLYGNEMRTLVLELDKMADIFEFNKILE